MMREEFEQRTGFYPSSALYAIIEKHYTEFNGDKDAFCKAYKKNAEGLAEKIQREADMETFKAQQGAEKAQKATEARIAELEKALEREQEWKPYEDTDNVQQADYDKLASQSDTERMSDEKAKDLLYEWYWAALVDRKAGAPWHYLKLDISKYFYRVDHSVLLGILARKYPGEDGFLWLMDTIINCDHTPFGLPPGKSADEVPPAERLFEVGMPIGNLTSQLLANVCLNELDQYIKHELKAHFYVRYMDDMVLLHRDAKTLNEWRALIEEYLNEVLHLELNSKTAIGLVKRGITFVGCRIFPGGRKPTRQSVKKAKARMRYIAKEYEAGLIDFDAVDATMQSYFGMLGHCSTHGLQKWIENNIKFKRRDGEQSQEVNTWT